MLSFTASRKCLFLRIGRPVFDEGTVAGELLVEVRQERTTCAQEDRSHRDRKPRQYYAPDPLMHRTLFCGAPDAKRFHPLRRGKRSARRVHTRTALRDYRDGFIRMENRDLTRLQRRFAAGDAVGLAWENVSFERHEIRFFPQKTTALGATPINYFEPR